MTVKLQRVVRTATSEEIVIRDTDLTDKDGTARTIGKLDVHYSEEGVYGTLLLWPEFLDAKSKADVDAFIQEAIIDELTAPIGVAGDLQHRAVQRRHEALQALQQPARGIGGVHPTPGPRDCSARQTQVSSDVDTLVC